MRVCVRKGEKHSLNKIMKISQNFTIHHFSAKWTTWPRICKVWGSARPTSSRCALDEMIHLASRLPRCPSINSSSSTRSSFISFSMVLAKAQVHQVSCQVSCRPKENQSIYIKIIQNHEEPKPKEKLYYHKQEADASWGKQISCESLHVSSRMLCPCQNGRISGSESASKGLWTSSHAQTWVDMCTYGQNLSLWNAH